MFLLSWFKTSLVYSFYYEHLFTSLFPALANPCTTPPSTQYSPLLFQLYSQNCHSSLSHANRQPTTLTMISFPLLPTCSPIQQPLAVFLQNKQNTPPPHAALFHTRTSPIFTKQRPISLRSLPYSSELTHATVLK